MANDIYDWSLTANDNATADSSINWAEGQSPGSVNNSSRNMMKRVAEFLDDIGGLGTTGGSANAITVTSAIASLATGKLLAFKAAWANTGACTLNAASLGARAIRLNGDIALAANTILANGIYVCRYDATYNSNAGAWVLLTPESYKPGGTDVALADGGTGTSLTDPNADRIMFWDDSAGQVTWLVPASGITISGTNVLLDSTYSPSFTNLTLTGAAGGLLTLANTTTSQALQINTSAEGVNTIGSYLFPITDYEPLNIDASAVFMRPNATSVGFFHSNGLHIKSGTSAPAFGVDAGIWLLTDGSVFATKFNNPAIEITRGTTDGAQVQFYRGSATVVGNITTTATNTAYNTSSDERLKALFRDFDAGAIIDQMTMYEYEWKADGSIGYGPRAQELFGVFPLAVTRGNDKEPGEEGFEPWEWLGNPLLALALREIQSLRRRMAEMEARIS